MGVARPLCSLFAVSRQTSRSLRAWLIAADPWDEVTRMMQ